MAMANTIPVMQYTEIGSGQPLVLAPGGLTGWLSWARDAAALAASRRVIRVQPLNIALGLAGEALPADYSVGYEVAAFGKALDELGIEQADLAGWSYGAMISLSYAIHHPQRIRSLTLIEPPAYWVLKSRAPLPAPLLDERKFVQTLATDDVSEAQLIQFLRTNRLFPEGANPRTLPQWPVWYEHRQSLRMADAVFQHDDSMALVRAFDRPVLLVKGEGSNPFLHQVIDVLAGEFPNARVITFPGGHAPHLVSAQAFMDAFTGFLTQPGS